MAAAVPIALALTAASTAYQVVQANQDRQAAKGAANAQEDAAKAAADKAAAASKEANDVSTANALRDQAKARQQQIIGAAMGRGSTILTSGLGVPQPATTANRTLLGQ